MRDRQILETLLARRFPGATLEEIAAAANAIMALDDDRDRIPGDRNPVKRDPDGALPAAASRRRML